MNSRNVALYFLAGTVAFLAVDLLLEAPIRVAALPDLPPRLAYYAFLGVLGVLSVRLPVLAPWLAAGESVVNLFLLLLSVLLPIWSLPEGVLAGGDPDTPLSAVGLLNVLLVGGVLIWTFHENARRALASPASPR